MADFEVIVSKVNSIQNCMQRIMEKAQNNPDWVSNLDSRDIIELNLVRAIQLCIDIAGYVIAEKKWGLPKTLAESFTILRKNNIIDHSLMMKMHKITGFRNIATHAYKQIDYNILKSIISHHLSDIEEFYTVILNSVN